MPKKNLKNNNKGLRRIIEAQKVEYYSYWA